MVNKLLTLFFAFMFAVTLSVVVFAQEAPKGDEGKAPAQGKSEKRTKQARWEGVVIRTDKNQSTITVRQAGTSVERAVHYDPSTRFTSQEHASKKVNDIDPSQIKEEDRVIVLGNYDKKGDLHATLISKRLSHSPQ